ncbi:MAG: phosphoribosylamine--glycine ligase [Armatimonadota bacterium]|nr:phosphoribosylamine--glycine ligase [Armatimonadota bacterium]
MRILVVGSGGREHALSWKIAQSHHCDELFCAPGNGGISRVAECVPIDAEEIEALGDFAEQERIDLTVVGPERPLIMGIADHFRSRGLTIYGPSAAAARLEGSKAFANQIVQRSGGTGKQFEVFDDPGAARDYVREQGAPIVIKADGDAAGKGVTVAESVDEALEAIDRTMVEKVFGPAGERVVIEECLFGQECSIKVFCDGQNILPMVPSQDYKRIYDGDEGPNTGGMGCYSPVPFLTDDMLQDILENTIQPSVEQMAADGKPYVGTLYAGMILPEDGPRLLEYNCRFGDPETQVVLPRLETDLVELLVATVEGRLDEMEATWRPDRCVCVICASGGYPGSYDKGKQITGLREAERDEAVMIFHAGTKRVGRRYHTDGGRVLGVTALGETYQQARDRAYNAVGQIDFEDMYFRTDIAERAVGSD